MRDTAASRAIWESFSRALGAEPREARHVRGASGLDHRVEMVALDEGRRRLIVVAPEASPRIAALVQADVQATMPGVRVLVARPILFDLGAFARQVVERLGLTELRLNEFVSEVEALQRASSDDPAAIMGQVLGGALMPFALALGNVTLPPLDQVLSLVQQAAAIDWEHLGRNKDDLSLRLGNLVGVDTMAADRGAGICPVPLYEFTEGDWDLLTGGRPEDVGERLRALGIHQYFFPPPDHLALGLVDGQVRRREAVVEATALAPSLGHPFGEGEVVSAGAPLPDLLDALQDRGLLVEGELGLEVTPDGSTTRASVKFRPREGVVAKLLQRFSVELKADTKDIKGLFGR